MDDGRKKKFLAEFTRLMDGLAYRLTGPEPAWSQGISEVSILCIWLEIGGEIFAAKRLVGSFAIKDRRPVAPWIVRLVDKPGETAGLYHTELTNYLNEMFLHERQG